MRLLIDNGANVKAMGGLGQDTPLAIAIAVGEETILRFLAQNNAPLTGIQNGSYYTPLQEAIIVEHFGTHKSLVPILLELGAEINENEPRFQRTALHIATELNRMETVQLLLLHGAFVNAKDSRNRTPLTIARQHGYRKLESLLKGEGAAITTAKPNGNACSSKNEVMQCTCSGRCFQEEQRCRCSDDP